MGQKVHPVGFRLPIRKNWESLWFGKTDFKVNLEEDYKIRKIIEKEFARVCVSRIVIERFTRKVRVTIHTPRPSMLIGKHGAYIDSLTKKLEKITSTGNKISIRLVEIKNYEADPHYVAFSIAQQLSNRSGTPYRRVMKRAVITAMMAGAQGIKVCCSGRLAGAEIARTEHVKQGRIPLHTLRADVDFCYRPALTVYGMIGVKVWVCKGMTHDANEQKGHGNYRRRSN